MGRFLQLRLTPPADYPLVAPKIKFITKVNLPGVIDSAGNVRAAFVPRSFRSLGRSLPSNRPPHIVPPLLTTAP